MDTEEILALTYNTAIEVNGQLLYAMLQQGVAQIARIREIIDAEHVRLVAERIHEAEHVRLMRGGPPRPTGQTKVG